MNTTTNFRWSGQNGYNWSSRGSNKNAANEAILSGYYLAFGIIVEPSRGPYERSVGYPLRCLSTVLGM